MNEFDEIALELQRRKSLLKDGVCYGRISVPYITGFKEFKEELGIDVNKDLSF